MTARPLVPESRRRPVSAAVALVLVMVAVLLAAGCDDPEDYAVDRVLIKLSGNGSLEWTKTVDFDFQMSGYSSLQRSDEGFIIRNFNMHKLLHFSPQGELLREQKLWQENPAQFSCGENLLIPTGDCGYILYGSNTICRFNQDGDLIWNRSFNIHEIISLIPTADHGFAIAGSQLDHPLQATVLNLDSDGNIIWQQSLASKNLEKAGLIIEFPERQEFIIFATEKPSENKYPRIFSVRLDREGTIVNLTAFDQAGSTTYLRTVLTLAQTGTENFTVIYADSKNRNDPWYPMAVVLNRSGFISSHLAYMNLSARSILTSDGGSFSAEFSVMENRISVRARKYDQYGIIKWEKTSITPFPRSQRDYLKEVVSRIQTSDGGYVLLCEIDEASSEQ
jgi:hypothetical protein